MKVKVIRNVFLFAGILILSSCTEYTPKPKGFFRIEPPDPKYSMLLADDLPYSFQASSLATVELPDIDKKEDWLNLHYPTLNARIYCSYFPITPSMLNTVLEESQALVVRQSRNLKMTKEQAFENPEKNVYATLYLLDGESPSPIQFFITDSTSNFFRGALLYDTTINADSLAPATSYIKNDIIELIQSFNWKK